jgi:gamma-glutamyl-gamma-aminobutyrate hydrolase PuuD
MIYVENDYDRLYGKFWAQLGKDVVIDRELFLARPQDFDLVCFTGGADVSPELYGHRDLGSSFNPPRDDIEKTVFELASDHEIPMTGICRGSQFLNVMCGGTMVQHLRKSHGGSPHMCDAKRGGPDPKTSEGLVSFEVTSSHHQMSVLGDGGIFLGNSKNSIPTETCGYDGDLRDLDENHVRWDSDGHYYLYVTEAFAYPEKKVFAVQHHPEWQDVNCDAAQWTLQMIREICFGEEKEVTA